MQVPISVPAHEGANEKNPCQGFLVEVENPRFEGGRSLAARFRTAEVVCRVAIKPLGDPFHEYPHVVHLTVARAVAALVLHVLYR